MNKKKKCINKKRVKAVGPRGPGIGLWATLEFGKSVNLIQTSKYHDDYAHHIITYPPDF